MAEQGSSPEKGTFYELLLRYHLFLYSATRTYLVILSHINTVWRLLIAPFMTLLVCDCLEVLNEKSRSHTTSTSSIFLFAHCSSLCEIPHSGPTLTKSVSLHHGMHLFPVLSSFNTLSHYPLCRRISSFTSLQSRPSAC